MIKYIPNILTILRFIAIPFFVLLSLYGHPLYALLVFIIACLTDYFDGKIARKFNIISNFGKLMDPLADKVLVLSALFLLCISPISYIHWSVFVIILLREVAVSILRYHYNKKKIVISANIWGKIKTLVQMTGIVIAFTIYTLFSLEISVTIIHYQKSLILFIQLYFWITSIITILSGVNYFFRSKAVKFNKIKCNLWFSVLSIFLLMSCTQQSKDTVVRSHRIDHILSNSENVLVTNSRKPRTWGHPQTIYVFADSNIWNINQPFLSYSLERYFFTTENEQLFQLVLADINNIKNFNRFNNIVFLCDINSTDPVSQYVKTIMSEQVIESVREKNVSMFMNDNLWSSDQLVIFFIGDKPENIRNYLYDNSETYFQLFFDRFIARITYSSRRLKGFKESFFNEMPFKMYIPETYKIFVNDLENNFISFLWRSKENQERNPDMYISVYWEKSQDDVLQEDWLFSKRAELAWKYYDEDEFNHIDIKSGKKYLDSREVWFLSGRWQNKKHYMGGTFQSFAFYDSVLEMIYVIDTSVYFPAGYKLRYLLELEGLAKTFIPKATNPKNNIEE